MDKAEAPLNIVHTEASLGWGGQEIRILTEAKGMQARGHKVRILCPENANLYNEAIKREIPVTPLPIGRKNLVGLKAIYRWLKQNKVDVINTHSSTDSWLVALASLFLRKAPPMVRTRHISAAIPKNLPTRWLYQRASAHIVTTGENLRQQLIDENRFDPTTITSVPTGIDTDLFQPGDKQSARQQLGLPEDAYIIGIVATLRSWKGHQYLIDAFSQLGFNNARLLIIGDGPVRQMIEQQVRQTGLDEQVIMTGNQADVPQWLNAMDLFVLPSYANEGVPQAILQAMLCRLPVISTPVGSITEIVRDVDTGLLVNPKDVNSLFTAMKKLIDRPELAKQLANNAYDLAKREFGIDRMLDQMTTKFSSVIR